MYLARIVGQAVASQKSPGLAGVALQLIQPIDEDGADLGGVIVACAAISVGPGDFVTFVDGREAAMACPDTFVPVDAAVIGFVSQAVRGAQAIGPLGC